LEVAAVNSRVYQNQTLSIEVNKVICRVKIEGQLIFQGKDKLDGWEGRIEFPAGALEFINLPVVEGYQSHHTSKVRILSVEAVEDFTE
jgi:hypothetical protein